MMYHTRLVIHKDNQLLLFVTSADEAR